MHKINVVWILHDNDDIVYNRVIDCCTETSMRSLYSLVGKHSAFLRKNFSKAKRLSLRLLKRAVLVALVEQLSPTSVTLFHGFSRKGVGHKNNRHPELLLDKEEALP